MQGVRNQFPSTRLREIKKDETKSEVKRLDFSAKILESAYGSYQMFTTSWRVVLRAVCF